MSKTEKQKTAKQLWCDCSVCRSVGGLQLVAQRCFCRQRSYQRDHARSRLILIAEAKPVWARSVLLWATRWESRVMLLFLFLFALQQSILFFLISSSHAHARSLLDLVGTFGWLFPFSSSHTHTLSLVFFFGRVCSSCCLHWRALCHTHTRTHTEGWLAGEHTGTQTTHHDGMRCHT